MTYLENQVGQKTSQTPKFKKKNILDHFHFFSIFRNFLQALLVVQIPDFLGYYISSSTHTIFSIVPIFSAQNRKVMPY